MNARPSPFVGSQNPLVQGLSLLVGAVLLVSAIVLGAFLLAIAVGIGLVFALVFMARVWWIRRKLESAAKSGAVPHRLEESEGRVIEAEYTVIDEERDDRLD